jgi:hypothetical protein
MKAIFTKYLGPTDVRGARIKASDHDGNSITVSYDHASHEPHRDAALALCKKLNWTGRLVEGSDSKAGNVYVWLQESAVVEVQS